MGSKRKPFNDHAGYVASLRSGAQRGWVVIYEAKAQGIDVDGKRYAIVCETHKTIVGTSSLVEARASMKHPDFCEACELIRRTAAAAAAPPANHTPEPWHVSKFNKYIRHTQSDGTCPNIADLSVFGGPPEEGLANGRLMVAAPKLLRLIRQFFHHGGWCVGCLNPNIGHRFCDCGALELKKILDELPGGK